MPYLLFLSTQFTYKRFLLLWAVVGLFLSDSRFTYHYGLIAADIINLLGIVCLVCTLYTLLIARSNFHFKISAFTVGILLYLLIAIISGLINRSMYFTNFIFRLAVPVVFCLSYIWVFTRNEVRTIVYALTIFGLVNVIIAYLVFFLTIAGNDAPFYISGLFNDRNGFSRYLTIINSYFLIEALTQRKKRQAIPYWAFIAIFFLGILIQYSRSGYVIYVICSALIVFTCGSKSAKKLAVWIIPLVAIVFMLFTYHRVIADKMNIVNYSDLTRVYLLKAGIKYDKNPSD